MKVLVEALKNFNILAIKIETKKTPEIVIFSSQNLESMDIREEKLHLIEELARIQDIHIIEQIRQLLEKTHNPIVGYTASGQSITQRDLYNK